VLSLLGLIGLCNVFASVSDLAATGKSGLPSDHTGTFAKLSGTTWAGFKAAHAGTRPRRPAQRCRHDRRQRRFERRRASLPFDVGYRRMGRAVAWTPE
jgi:hypothetical protein